MSKVCHKCVEVHLIVARVQGFTGKCKSRLNGIQIVANWPPGQFPTSECFDTHTVRLVFNWSVMLTLTIASLILCCKGCGKSSAGLIGLFWAEREPLFLLTWK